ncbi:MAG: aldehyde ferredoxin oxidoreductase family protein, partial [Candidatus Ranarchaeia archaeon]
MAGYSYRYWHVDLEKENILRKNLAPEILHKTLGGEGLATFLVYQLAPTGVDAFSPENPLVFTIGPFAGSPIPCSSKFAGATKSPLTGLIGYGISSGFFGLQLRRTGVDAIIVTGRLKTPKYLYLTENGGELIDATSLWGMRTVEAEHEIKKDLGSPDVSVASIGPAGENKVRFALINNDDTRQLGRTGLGAVMGSKKLKAIAVEGTLTPTIFDVNSLWELIPGFIKECRGKATAKYRIWGTSANVLALNNLGAIPSFNYRQTTFDGAEKISGEEIIKNYLVKHQACGLCPINCDHICEARGDPRFGTARASPEYETLYALGSNCGIDDLPAILWANQLCDELGMDTISTGVTIAWAMEASEKGLLSHPDVKHLNIRFGNTEALIRLIEKIAYRKGLGNLLADGTRLASSKIGKGTEYFAMHVKGLEYPGYTVRTLKSAAIGFSTSTRGACHLRNAAYSFDVSGKMDRFVATKEHGPLVKEIEDFYAVYDSLILCKFIRNVIKKVPLITRLYYLVTGIKLTEQDILETGERIVNLQQLFNIREGLLRRHFYPPPKVLSEPVPDGPGKGTRLPVKEFDLMLDAYFNARSWNHEGRPM